MLKLTTLININTNSSIYSADINNDSELCLPVPSDNKVYFFNLKNKQLLYTVNLYDCNPDLAIYIDTKRVLIGCQQTSLPVIIEENKTYHKIEVNTKNFFPTSFKLSADSKLFLGNFKGNPIIYENSIFKEIDIKTNSSYDCLWISNQYLLISCIKDAKVKLIYFSNDKIEIIQTLDIIYPYRFSPLVDGLCLLTCKGWKNRPGKIYILHIDFNLNGQDRKPFIKIIREIIVPPSLFLIQRLMPKFILNIKGFEKYTGYINDIAWFDNKSFIVTTREGNALILFDLNGNVIDILRLSFFRPTRFISNRLPGTPIILIDAFQNRVLELENINK